MGLDVSGEKSSRSDAERRSGEELGDGCPVFLYWCFSQINADGLR